MASSEPVTATPLSRSRIAVALMPTPARPIKWALRNGNAVIVALSGSSRIMRRPIHRIRAAHGCEHLRYASDPSSKECALRRLPRPRAVGGDPPRRRTKPESSCSSSHPIGSDGRIVTARDVHRASSDYPPTDTVRKYRPFRDGSDWLGRISRTSRCPGRTPDRLVQHPSRRLRAIPEDNLLGQIDEGVKLAAMWRRPG